MLLQSETAGCRCSSRGRRCRSASWALLLFGAFAFALVPRRAGRGPPLGAVRSRRDPLRKVDRAVVGGALGFFLASYTGVLLSVTNRPIWADTTLLGALFLASAASTRRGADPAARPAPPRGQPATRCTGSRRFDTWAHGRSSWSRWSRWSSRSAPVARVWLSVWGLALLVGVVLVGILVPLLLHWRPRLLGASQPAGRGRAGAGRRASSCGRSSCSRRRRSSRARWRWPLRCSALALASAGCSPEATRARGRRAGRRRRQPRQPDPPARPERPRLRRAAGRAGRAAMTDPGIGRLEALADARPGGGADGAAAGASLRAADEPGWAGFVPPLDAEPGWPTVCRCCRGAELPVDARAPAAPLRGARRGRRACPRWAGSTPSRRSRPRSGRTPTRSRGWPAAAGLERRPARHDRAPGRAAAPCSRPAGRPSRSLAGDRAGRPATARSARPGRRWPSCAGSRASAGCAAGAAGAAGVHGRAAARTASAATTASSATSRRRPIGESRRATTCDACRGYLKTVSVLGPASAAELAISGPDHPRARRRGARARLRPPGAARLPADGHARAGAHAGAGPAAPAGRPPVTDPGPRPADSRAAWSRLSTPRTGGGGGASATPSPTRSGSTSSATCWRGAAEADPEPDGSRAGCSRRRSAPRRAARSRALCGEILDEYRLARTTPRSRPGWRPGRRRRTPSRSESSWPALPTAPELAN